MIATIRESGSLSSKKTIGFGYQSIWHDVTCISLKIYHSASANGRRRCVFIFKSAGKTPKCLPALKLNMFVFKTAIAFLVAFELPKKQKCFNFSILLRSKLYSQLNSRRTNSAWIRFYFCLRRRKPRLRGFKVFPNGIVEEPVPQRLMQWIWTAYHAPDSTWKRARKAIYKAVRCHFQHKRNHYQFNLTDHVVFVPTCTGKALLHRLTAALIIQEFHWLRASVSTFLMM